ncbi:MAG: HDIG domain-containing protein [Anaerolineae bacterium]|nr:HDIG domain-containing protein [Thermoflexales bacterium]MDW8408148.1 HDIG domain-containing protein [Anaerolineae bacterium]
MATYTRQDGWVLVNEYTTDPNLVRHMLMVETAMRAYAPRFGGDPELWGLVGLIHDFDYQRWPNLDGAGHPNTGASILRAQGWDEIIVRAVLAHAEELTGVKPESMMEKTLCAVDELVGFIAAVAYVRPSKNIADVQVSSVKKKWKDKAFAAGVHRDQIERATERLGIPLDEHIAIVLAALQANAPALGLDGAKS